MPRFTYRLVAAAAVFLAGCHVIGPPPTPTTTTSPPDAGDLLAVDWWGCWRAADAVSAQGLPPADGTLVSTVPNCAQGPSSVGAAGDLSHATAPPIYRTAGAGPHASIEFTYQGNTLLHTNGGLPWSGDDILAGSDEGVTLAWIGMMTDVNSHSVKYLVSGLDSQSEYPLLMVEGEGPNRFAGYAGGSRELRSSDGTVIDDRIHGVILHLAPNGSTSEIVVDNTDVVTSQDSPMGADMRGLTLGNFYSQGFSTTDHQFLFLGLRQGRLTTAETAAFWAFVESL